MSALVQQSNSLCYAHTAGLPKSSGFMWTVWGRFWEAKIYANIDFWDGDGFKIEKTIVNDINVILITNAKVVPKSSQTFLKTDLACVLQ